VTTIGLDDLGTSTTLESNKSPQLLPAACELAGASGGACTD